MKSKAGSVDQYIEQLSDDRKVSILLLRGVKLILQSFFVQ